MGKIKEQLLARHGNKTIKQLKDIENQIIADSNLSQSLQDRTDKERVKKAEKKIKEMIKASGY